MSVNREEKALREFKQIIGDLTTMLRLSTGAETVYMYWVNRARSQFVLETTSTSLSNVMFRDRISIDEHFLEPWHDLDEPLTLKGGRDIDLGLLEHYYDRPPVREVTILPFINNGETVALTVLESSFPFHVAEHELSLSSWRSALGNVLNTYLELTELYDEQQKWIGYEESLERLHPRYHKVEILTRMVTDMERLLPNGGVSLVARGMESWVNVLNASESEMSPGLGLMIDEKSLAYEALNRGEARFSIHFNQSPKRLATGEAMTEGASMAIPLMIDDRRHGCIIAYDRNPLTFTEALKHKLLNLVRVAALAIRVNLGKLSPEENLLTSPYGSFIPDVWEAALERALQQRHPRRNTWFGFLTIDNLQLLRPRHRLDELQQLQRVLISELNPSRFGVNGYIGFYSDYVYPFILQGGAEHTAETWIQGIRKVLREPVVLRGGQRCDVSIAAVTTRLHEVEGDTHQLIQQTKRALSRVLKEENQQQELSGFQTL